MSAVQGADLTVNVILVLGFANLVADAISMGVGDYLSEKAENDFNESEYEREKWEFENFKMGEISEMIDLYVQKYKVKAQDAEQILKAMARYPDLFIDHMMAIELQILHDSTEQNQDKDKSKDKDEDSKAKKKCECVSVGDMDDEMKNGVVTLLSFMAFGCVPLLSYVMLVSVKFKNAFDPRFLISILLTVCTLLTLGALKAKMTESSMWKSAFFVAFNGCLAAAASFAIGDGLSRATGTHGLD